MVARGIPEKGWRCAIEAFLTLDAEKSELRLVGESAHLNALAREFTDTRIKFMGYSSNPLKEINEFDVGMLPSYYGSESLPTTVIEYMVCGKPMVISRIGEVDRMMKMEGKYCGIIVDLVDGRPQTESWCEAMRQMLSQERRQRWGDLSRQASAKFDMNSCVTNYIGMYSEELNLTKIGGNA